MRGHILLVGLSVLGVGLMAFAACGPKDDPNQPLCGAQVACMQGPSGVTTVGSGGGTGGETTTGGGEAGIGGAQGPGGMGSGGMMATGQGGAGAEAGAGGATSTTTSVTSTGVGGSPPMEKPVHGCLSTTAIDMTSMPSFTVTHNSTIQMNVPYCVKVKFGTTITQNGSSFPGNGLYLGGTYEEAFDFKSYDNMSPIQPNCYNCTTFPSCFDPNASPSCPNAPCCYNGGTWVMKKYPDPKVGAFPFYDNGKPKLYRGAIYVIQP